MTLRPDFTWKRLVAVLALMLAATVIPTFAQFITRPSIGLQTILFNGYYPASH